jgi:hypothetical protein
MNGSPPRDSGNIRLAVDASTRVGIPYDPPRPKDGRSTITISPLRLLIVVTDGDEEKSDNTVRSVLFFSTKNVSVTESEVGSVSSIG